MIKIKEVNNLSLYFLTAPLTCLSSKLTLPA